MKLQSQKSREYNGKTYQKHWVVLPNKILEQLGWKTKDDLDAYVDSGKLVIKRN